MKSEIINNRIVIWDIDDSKTLFKLGYFGKPIGIPKPKPDEIDAPLILDLIEGYYLVQQSKIKVYRNKKRITQKEIVKICREEYHEFDKKYLVYKDFRDKGYIVNPGIKFGCDFAVYERGPGIDHAPYLVQVYVKTDSISTVGIVLAGRLATTVRKQFIFAIPHRNQVEYIAIDWWKA